MKAKKYVESSQPERLVRRSEADIRAYAESPAAKEASARLRRRLRANGGEPTAEDLKEIAELTDKELRLLRPVKAPVTLRIDGDIFGVAEIQRREVSDPPERHATAGHARRTEALTYCGNPAHTQCSAQRRSIMAPGKFAVSLAL